MEIAFYGTYMNAMAFLILTYQFSAIERYCEAHMGVSGEEMHRFAFSFAAPICVTCVMCELHFRSQLKS